LNTSTSSAALVRPQPGTVRAWVLACRPATLTAAVAPVLVGAAVAHHLRPLATLPLIATFLGACLLQIASNFANDVFDFEKGADTIERLGPTRAVQAGLLSPAQMKTGLWVVIALALLVGSYLIAVAGWPILAIGLSGIVAAVAYTGGPYPLGYHGWGDVFVFLFFGLIAVGGTCFVQTGALSPLALFCAIPVGALATNILVVNNLRDRHTDRSANKRTLAVRFGKKAVLVQYCAQLSVSYAVPVVLYATGRASWWILLPWVSAPLSVSVLKGVFSEEGRALNPLLVATARLVFVFGALFAVGLFLGLKS